MKCFAIISLALLSSAYSQVVVYNIDFDEAGPNANYRSYDRGFAVMPLSGGDADFVLQFQDGATLYYVQVPEFGTYYVATEGNDRQGVVANAATQDTPINFFMAIGNVNTTIRATVTTTDPDTNVSSTSQETEKVPDELEGYILTADPSGSGVFDANSGAAGASEMSLSINAAQTNLANQQQLSVAETIAALVESLERAGWQEFFVADDDEELDVDGAG